MYRVIFILIIQTITLISFICVHLDTEQTNEFRMRCFCQHQTHSVKDNVNIADAEQRFSYIHKKTRHSCDYTPAIT